MTKEDFREILVRDHSEAFAYSYFDKSYFKPGTPPELRPWSFTADRKFKEEARNTIQREGIKLLTPNPEHLKPTMRRAA